MAMVNFGKILRAIADGPEPSRLPAPSEVIPTLEVGNAAPEDQYLKGEYRYTGYAIEAAAAGNRSQVGLWLPADTGTMAIVEGIFTRSNHAALVLTQIVASPLDDDGTEYPLDYRLRAGTLTFRPNTCQVRSQTAGLLGYTMTRAIPNFSDAANANYWYAWRDPIILWPGTGVVTCPAGDNNDNQTTFVWRERRFDALEVLDVDRVRTGFYS